MPANTPVENGASGSARDDGADEPEMRRPDDQQRETAQVDPGERTDDRPRPRSADVRRDDLLLREDAGVRGPHHEAENGPAQHDGGRGRVDLRRRVADERRDREEAERPPEDGPEDEAGRRTLPDEAAPAADEPGAGDGVQTRQDDRHEAEGKHPASR